MQLKSKENECVCADVCVGVRQCLYVCRVVTDIIVTSSYHHGDGLHVPVCSQCEFCVCVLHVLDCYD